MDYFIELNSKYFFKNIEIIKNISSCIIAPVIKSNAYGHGVKEIITLLKNDQTIKQICVVNCHEALVAKENGWKNKIIIMSSSNDIQIDEQYEYFLYSFDFLSSLLKKAQFNNLQFQVHIKLNCGMNRLGFDYTQVNKLIELLIKNTQYIKVVGIATHLPRLNYVFDEEIRNQIGLFNKLVKKLQKIFGYDLLIHPFSSKGINLIQKSNASCNMVRVGGALYGLLNNEQKKILLKENPSYDLRQIMTLKAKVIMIQAVKKDEYIGYGENYKTKKNETIAIVSFGYGYGYSMSLNSAIITGYCNNEYLGFSGLITMNMLFFDITHAKNKIVCGDYVILTSNDIVEIRAANLSNHYIGRREYTFTTMLHESIQKIII